MGKSVDVHDSPLPTISHVGLPPPLRQRSRFGDPTIIRASGLTPEDRDDLSVVGGDGARRVSVSQVRHEDQTR